MPRKMHFTHFFEQALAPQTSQTLANNLLQLQRHLHLRPTLLFPANTSISGEAVRAMMYGRRVSVNVFGSQENSQAFYRSRGPSTITIPFRKCKGLVQVSPAANQKMNYLVGSQNIAALSIMVNGCTGKMGKAVLEAAVSAGIHIVPVSFGGLKNAGKTVQVGGKDIQMYGPYERERILASILNDYPNLIVVDYTVPAAVNGKHLSNFWRKG
ncbi:unnamed protein product [Ilex paraguariensis]|uniref:Dihydrodipicolinate reductase N-terminal domain-containing protein n=1 Tax=Ilex paraguariensis TaxID=185542 RepID=A0ABC8V3N0_9AQUA